MSVTLKTATTMMVVLMTMGMTSLVRMHSHMGSVSYVLSYLILYSAALQA